MADEVLTTKLFCPPPRTERIPRKRLFDRLDEGLGGKVVLISAPAGFGKTTLVSEWVSVRNRPAAWLSLDERDGDSITFLKSLIASLQTINLTISKNLSVQLRSPAPPPATTLLSTLINAISRFPEDFVIVLDDYHTVDSPSVDAVLNNLISQMPAQMHLIVITREDPDIPMALLRGRRELTEIRVSDIRCSNSETADFLNGVMALDLSDEDIATLESRTEGWITGLQLAAISIAHRENAHGFIRNFAGDNRFIVDYLMEEVMRHQGEDISEFLLDTSILDRFCAPLCDFVTGRQDSRKTLENIEKANLFIVPLDDKRLWYRYHHLFADLLAARLMNLNSKKAMGLHKRAAEWFKNENLPGDAIRHSLAAGDNVAAANLAEQVWPDWNESVRSITWLSWIRKIPDDLIHQRPLLCVAMAWAFLNKGELEAAGSMLAKAELISADGNSDSALEISLTTARAYHAQAIGNLSDTERYTQDLLSLLPDSDYYQRGTALVLLGLANWAAGRTDVALAKFTEGIGGMQRSGRTYDLITGTFVLAEMYMGLGKLGEAKEVCRSALGLAESHGDPMPLGTEDVYSVLSEIDRERGDLESSERNLARCQELGEQVDLPDWRYRWLVVRASLDAAFERFDSALEFLAEAENVFVRTPVPDIRPVSAMMARIRIRQGDISGARAWADKLNLMEDEIDRYIREYEYLTLVRLQIAECRQGPGNHKQSNGSGSSDVEPECSPGMLGKVSFNLDRILGKARQNSRKGSILEILILQAIIFEISGDIEAAGGALAEALSIAEPEGYLRIFLDEGPNLLPLFRELRTLKISSEYAVRLQRSMDMEISRAADPRGPASISAEMSLSRRELEVLECIAQGLSNEEIGTALFVSVSTVKGHNRHIFEKLGVKRRTEAVALARDYGLI